MDPETEAKTAETSESQETKETTEATSAQPSESEDRFEDPDFSALTNFVESDGEATVEAAETEQKTETEEETSSSQESASQQQEGESKGASEEKKEETTEVKTEKKEETPEEKAAREAADKAEADRKAAEAAQQQQQQDPPVKIPTKEELQGMYDEHRKATLPKLEELFQLSEEDAAALDEAPSKVIPKLAGQMMYDTMLSTYNAVLAAMPSVVNRLIESSNSAREAEKAFYDAWPDLKSKEARQAVATAINAYRSANPRANLQDVIQNAGVMAMINIGKDPRKQEPAQQQPQAPTPRPTPPKPAGAGGTSQVAPPKKQDAEDNVFAELAGMYAQEYR